MLNSLAGRQTQLLLVPGTLKSISCNPSYRTMYNANRKLFHDDLT